MYRALASLLFVLTVSAFSMAGTRIHHALHVNADPATHMLTVIDTVTIPAAQVRKNLTFILNDQLNVRPTTPGITITIDAKHV
ncbi:MAG TPA: hypothetical protein VK470_01185, partial [Bacteroidota bacterium]|nr:hypothetical protein [Bacteroidota bacterium]